jgi:hypothetical protein
MECYRRLEDMLHATTDLDAVWQRAADPGDAYIAVT